MERKWWHDKVAYQIYQKAFMTQTETVSATYRNYSKVRLFKSFRH